MPSFEIASNVFKVNVPLHVNGNIGVGTKTPMCGVDIQSHREFNPKYAPLNMFDFAPVNGKEMTCGADGNVVAIGKAQNSVMVYHRINNRWTPFSITIDDIPANFYRAPLYASKGVAEAALSADGTRIAVAKGATETQKNGNVVEIHHFENGQWLRKAYLHQSGAFGWSICMSGDGSTVVASAPENPTATGIYVYKYNVTSDSWDLACNRTFGAWCDNVTVNNDGSIVALSHGSDVSAQDPTNVSVYVWNLQDANGQPVELKAPAGTIGWHNFGKNVLISNDGCTLAVSAPGQLKHGSAQLRNAVYIYRKDAGAWDKAPVALRPSSTASDNMFGVSMTFNRQGTMLVVGAPLETVNSSKEAGSVYVYQHLNNTWTQTGVMHRAENRKSFGLSVALANDNDTLFVMADKGNNVWGAIQYNFVNTALALSADGHANIKGDLVVAGDIYKNGGLLNIQTDGSNIYIPAGGNLGIGTTPGPYALNVSTGNAMFNDGLYVATNRGTCLGVGLQNPTAKLHVKGSTLFDGDAAIKHKFNVQSTMYGADDTNQIYITRGNDVTTMNHLTIHANGSLPDSGVAFVSNNDTTHMFVKANTGFVGMGTIWPQEKLHVIGNTKVEGDVMVSGNLVAKVIDEMKAMMIAQEQRIATLEAKIGMSS